MPDFRFHVAQHFDCTYIVEDTSTVEEAWDRLTNGESSECYEQEPGAILTSLSSSGVAVRDNIEGDWEDIDA